MSERSERNKILPYQAEKILDALVSIAPSLAPEISVFSGVADHVKQVTTALIDACVEINRRTRAD